MQYVHEIIELMGAFPGRDFRIGYIINYVRNGRELTEQQAIAMRKGVERALQALQDSGSVGVVRPFTNQRGWAYYHWKMRHEGVKQPDTNATQYATLSAGKVPLGFSMSPL